MIRAIAAIDAKRGLASGDTIPWHIGSDVRYFRDHTMGHPIIMGYATYENLAWPLPGRDNLVASRRHSELRPGFHLLSEVDKYLQPATEDVWIIGGAKLFESTLPFIDALYLTQVEGDFGCNKFFPDYTADFTDETVGPWRQEDGFHFRFCVFRRPSRRRGSLKSRQAPSLAG